MDEEEEEEEEGEFDQILCNLWREILLLLQALTNELPLGVLAPDGFGTEKKS